MILNFPPWLKFTDDRDGESYPTGKLISTKTKLFQIEPFRENIRCYNMTLN